MYAFISNEYRGIVNTQRQLNFLLSIYSYPKFVKVNSELEAKKFFASCDREFLDTGIYRYGKKTDSGYVTIEYYIDGKNIYANVHTKYLGFIRLPSLPKNVKQDCSYDLIKLKVCDVNLEDELISHHCIAIRNLLGLFNEFINIEIILPDISVYLAITKYKGSNFAIKRLQSYLKKRAGEVYYTIRR